jgi:hypothetical protein
MTGHGSFRLASEIADGVHIACAHSSEALSFAARHVRAGADRIGRRLDASFDLCASVLGAISSDSGAAKEAARVAAAFYLSSMAPELVGRHGIDYAEVRPVIDAFGRGEVERALGLTTPEIGERLSIAGDPAEWTERLRRDFAAHGYDHVALGLVDPSLVESWSGRRIDGVPTSPGNPAPRPADAQRGRVRHPVPHLGNQRIAHRPGAGSLRDGGHLRRARCRADDLLTAAGHRRHPRAHPLHQPPLSQAVARLAVRLGQLRAGSARGAGSPRRMLSSTRPRQSHPRPGGRRRGSPP